MSETVRSVADTRRRAAALMRSVHATKIVPKELVCPADFDILLQRLLDNEATGRHDPVEIHVIRGYYRTAWAGAGRSCDCIGCRTIQQRSSIIVPLRHPPMGYRSRRARRRIRR